MLIFLLALLSFFSFIHYFRPGENSPLFLSLALALIFFSSFFRALILSLSLAFRLTITRVLSFCHAREQVIEKKGGNSNERKAVPITAIDIRQIVPLAFLCSLME